MKEITSLREIIDAAAASEKKLYIRWSRGPVLDKKHGKSLDQVSGTRHNGLSVQNVRADNPQLLASMIPEYQFLRRKDAKIYCWILSAERNGTDSDDAPTVDANTITPIGRVSEDLITKCIRFSRAKAKKEQEYCNNAWKPEHYEINARIDAEYAQSWSEIA